MKLQRRIRILHKLAGALVGIQILLWMASGLYMTAVPIDIIRGNHLIQGTNSNALPTDGLLNVSDVLAQYPNTHSLELRIRLGEPVYVLQDNASNQQTEIHAITGDSLAPVSSTQALFLAEQQYKGKGRALEPENINDYSQAPDARGRPLPLWRIQFTDTFNTRFYLSQRSGEVLAVRTDLWRIFDFFWMLHIMDYDERKDFNNPLVILMATLGLFLTLSGLLLVLQVMRKKGVSGLVK